MLIIKTKIVFSYKAQIAFKTLKNIFLQNVEIIAFILAYKIFMYSICACSWEGFILTSFTLMTSDFSLWIDRNRRPTTKMSLGSIKRPPAEIWRLLYRSGTSGDEFHLRDSSLLASVKNTTAHRTLWTINVL